MPDSVTILAGAPQMQPRRLLLRQLPVLALAALAVWIGLDALRLVGPGAILGALDGIGPGQWLGALLATVVSFAAIGRTESACRALAGQPLHAAQRRAGIAAIATGQLLGFGVLTGALVRCRILPQHGFAAALRFSTLVSALTLAALILIAALTVLLGAGYDGVPQLRGVMAGVVLAGAAGLAACAILPPLRLGGRCLHPPSVVQLGRILGWVGLDCAAAAHCFWVLLPPGAVSPAGFAPLFLLAFAAGALAGAPLGLGSMEWALLLGLPDLPPEQVLAAAMAFRLVYFGLPGLAALGLLVAGPARAQGRAVGRNGTALPHAPLHPAAAEAQLARQGRLTLLPGGGLLCGVAGQALVSLLDPALPAEAAVAGLCAQASRSGRMPCFYKIGPRLAAALRARGWSVAALGHEAWLAPDEFDLATPARAQLRRKLRRAQAAGITLRPALGADGPHLARIAADWALAHGGERGFSMGRFDPATLWHQRLFVALADGRPCAFVSFHAAPGPGGEWALDLMRHDRTTPDGAMHALIVAALGHARAAGVARLSLAAAPRDPAPRDPAPHDPVPTAGLAQPVFGRAAGALLRRAGGGGLRQFKQSFAPRWTPLYLAAPGRLRLMLCAAEIARAILCPEWRLRRARPGPEASRPAAVCQDGLPVA